MYESIKKKKKAQNKCKGITTHIGITYNSGTRDHLANVMENLPQEFLGLFPQSIAHAAQSTDRQEAHEGVVEEESKQTSTLRLIYKRVKTKTTV